MDHWRDVLDSSHFWRRYRFQLPGVPRIGGLPPLFGTIVRSTRSATVDFQEAGDSGVSGQVTIQEVKGKEQKLMDPPVSKIQGSTMGLGKESKSSQCMHLFFCVIADLHRLAMGLF